MLDLEGRASGESGNIDGRYSAALADIEELVAEGTAGVRPCVALCQQLLGKLGNVLVGSLVDREDANEALGLRLRREERLCDLGHGSGHVVMNGVDIRYGEPGRYEVQFVVRKKP